MRTSQKLSFQEIKALSAVVMIAICGTLGIDIHLASMPHIMQYMHTTQQHMQQSISFFLLGMGASLLFYGPLSDKYGRKPIVILGLTLAILASFASIFTTNIQSFLLTRILQGIGSGVCMGLGRTIIADILHGERLAIYGSYFSMFVSLSPLLAPTLGGYIQHWFDWKANFIALGVFLLLALSCYAVLCPETNKHKNQKALKIDVLLNNYKSLSLNPVFLGFTILSGIAMATAMAYSTISSFMFQQEFHLSPIIYGWVTAIAGAGGLVGKFFNPYSIKRIGGLKTLLIGLFLILFAGLWLIFFITIGNINVSLIIIAVFFTIFAQAFISPTSTSKALTPFHEKRGAAGALYGSFQMLTAFIVSAIIGVLAHDGVLVLALTYVLLGLLGLCVYLSKVKMSH